MSQEVLGQRQTYFGIFIAEGEILPGFRLRTLGAKPAACRRQGTVCGRVALGARNKLAGVTIATRSFAWAANAKEQESKGCFSVNEFSLLKQNMLEMYA